MPPRPDDADHFLTGAAVPEVEAALAVPADPTAAAFFDVDNTVMMGASMFHFARGLARRKYFTARDLAAFAVKQIRFRLGGESHGDIATAREAALAFVAGKPVAEIVTVGREIFDKEMSDRIWSGTRALTRLHLDAGERVWLVTATPVELAEIIADRLGLTGALGTVAESRDGYYTGHLLGSVLHGADKAAAVHALADAEGLDLRRCAAYSDSINDLPLLELVGQPVAVNPDSALRVEATARGWEIRDFRTARTIIRAGAPVAVGGLALSAAVLAGHLLRRWHQATRPARARAGTKRPGRPRPRWSRNTAQPGGWGWQGPLRGGLPRAVVRHRPGPRR
jgi:HAD superfamily hydrolase (TIGR01490 family)